MVYPQQQREPQRFFKRRRTDHHDERGCTDGRPPYRRDRSLEHHHHHDWRGPQQQRRHTMDHRYDPQPYGRDFQRQHYADERRPSLPQQERRRSIAWIPPSKVKQTVSSGALQQEIRRKETRKDNEPNPNTEDQNQTSKRKATNACETPSNNSACNVTASRRGNEQEVRHDETFQFTKKEGRMVEATDPTVASTATQITLEKVMPPSEVVLQSKLLLVSDFSPSPPNHSSESLAKSSPGRTVEEASLIDMDPIPTSTETPKDPPKVAARSDCSDLSLLQVGSRVAIYWDGEQKYFKATIKKHDASRAKPFYVRYDDGDREWMSFENERFRIVKKRKKKKEVEEAKEESQVRKVPPDYQRRAESDGKDFDPPEAQLDDSLKAKSVSSITSECDALVRVPRDDKENQITEAKRKETVFAEGDGGKADAIDRSISSDSDTDEDELNYWAHKMLGAPLPVVVRKEQEAALQSEQEEVDVWDHDGWGDAVMSISEKVKLGRSRHPVSVSSPSIDKPRKKKRKKLKSKDKDAEVLRKQQAKPLTADEIRAILAEDCSNESGCSTWVRRSMRQPSRSALDSSRVKDLIHKLTSNDPDMVVLKMKKYCSDLDTPQIVIDAVLDALEENRNCEALYIQNFNEGVRDEQVLHLLKILQQPNCKIWCLNIGETYKVATKTWKKFAKGLRRTKVTHMYASEHTISTELKDFIRATIRDNRTKHTMHIDAHNLGTIVRCTHCWWNPINAKSLRPYIRQAGFENILEDAEALGLRGTSSGSTLS